MSERDIAGLLADSGVFSGLSTEQLGWIAGCGQITPLANGEMLFREGEESNAFYLLRHGTVALELYIPGRGPVIVSTHGAGELVGWSWLFPPYRWHLDARITEAGSAIVFDGACLRGKAESDHDLGYELMKRFAAQMVERLQETRLQILDVYGRAATG